MYVNVYTYIYTYNELPQWLNSKEFICDAGVVRDTGFIPDQEDPLEEGMATHSSILAWRIPWTEEPVRL